MADILATFTGRSIGGQMKRLEDDYAVIRRTPEFYQKKELKMYVMK